MNERVIHLVGSTVDLSKLEKLKKNWEKQDKKTYHCKLHDTYFDPEQEPCWQCYNRCEEIF